MLPPTSIRGSWKRLVTHDAPPVLYAGLIFWFSSRPYTELEETWVKAFPDLLLHGVEFGILALLVFRQLYLPTRIRNLYSALLIAFLIASGYGALDEWHQSFIPGRHMDIRDWIADSLGAFMALLGAWIYYHRKPG